ncbi:MAG: hypothetical protein ACR2IE_20135 [Candidatus Sumerlaeaceae bacterium]
MPSRAPKRKKKLPIARETTNSRKAASRRALVVDFREPPFLAAPLLLLVLLFAIVAALFSISDPDIWWHLKTGQWILSNSTLPWKEPFTHTVPEGKTWYDVHWLFQVFAAAIHRMAGWNGLIGSRALLVCLFAGILWKWLQSLAYSAVFRAATIVLVLGVCRERFAFRPELPTFALVALVLYLYDRAVRLRKLPILALFGIQLFWANWHSSCILGLALGTLFAACVAWQRRQFGRSGFDDPSFSTRSLLLFCAGLLGASLLNPNGYVPLIYGLGESQKKYVLEFKPLQFGMLWESLGLVLILLPFGWRVFTRAPRYYWWIVLAAFAVAMLQTNRFKVYFAIAAAPGIAEALKNLTLWLLQKPRVSRYGGIAAGILLIVAAVGASLHHDQKDHPFLSFGADTAGYPVHACEFVVRENLHGRLYNDMGNGGYLLWKLAPERKVLVFGETRLNGPLLDRMYARPNTPDDWRKIFDDTAVTYAVLNCATGKAIQAGSKTVPQVIQDLWADWILVFWDDDAMVFAKDLPENRDLIARRACIVNPEAIPYRNSPVDDISSLEALAKDTKKWPAVETELNRAIKDSPRHFRAALALGLMRDARGDNTTGALQAYKVAESIDPDSPQVVQALGRWHIAYGRPEDAIHYMKRAAPLMNSADGYYYLAKMQSETGQHEEALDNLDTALELEPSYTAAINLRAAIRAKSKL